MTILKPQALILDMDGVLWRANEPIGDLAVIFEKIRALGIKFAFATNNATKTIAYYVTKLNQFGIPVDAQQIFTSAKVTAQVLTKRHPTGGRVHIVGEHGLHSMLADAGFTHQQEDVFAVVVGLDTNVNYQSMRQATLLIRKGAEFIGTNPDRTFPTPEGLVPGAGSLLAAIEAATDQAPEIIGKPAGTIFKQAMAYLQTAPEQTLVVGDRYETDITGGRAAGCRTALVLSGVTTPENAQQLNPRPDHITANLATLIEKLA